ncbi:hypothetical protein GGX14DRAFT_386232 [Mycena pura]|uniref:Uncharacterized protein n=1 Tax=Mycena pura TaxID=153505 RepID=A0AAD6YP34_9AGAR|nr:hypothetical protein GGX14DRAFT_386232 [Mycena pura]
MTFWHIGQCQLVSKLTRMHVKHDSIHQKVCGRNAWAKSNLGLAGACAGSESDTTKGSPGARPEPVMSILTRTGVLSGLRGAPMRRSYLHPIGGIGCHARIFYLTSFLYHSAHSIWPLRLDMPELAEILAFRAWLEWFIGNTETPGALKILSLWADPKSTEKGDMQKREERLMEFAATLSEKMFCLDFHCPWAVRLERIAASIPDTHGLLIIKVSGLSGYKSFTHIYAEAWERLPMPEPWFKQPNVDGFKPDTPSNSGLVSRLNKYMPPTWRGKDPDRRLTEQRPPPKDDEWDDPLEGSSGMDKFEALTPTAPSRLANPGSSKIKKSKSKRNRDKVSQSNTKLTSHGFSATKASLDLNPKSVAGVSTKLESMGVKKTAKRKPEQCTDKDIDHSLYLWPNYLFPELDKAGVAETDVFANLDLELIGTEYDARDIILDLKACYLEIEPLLHTSPQIYTNEEWEGVTRVTSNSNKRGFKVVLALQMVTHTLAWLSNDNNCHTYWFSRADMDIARPGRVPDVVQNYRGWCEYVAKWLELADKDNKLDMRSVGDVLSSAGNQPWRAVGRYSLDEIAARAGIELWMLWGKLKKDVPRLTAAIEMFYLFALERYCAVEWILAKSRELNKKRGTNSFLLITTKDCVTRQLFWMTSDRIKRLSMRYNRLSIRSYRTLDNPIVVHPVTPVRMPPDAPTLPPVPPYASQYLQVATNLRSPFSEPVNLRMSLTNIHDRPHNLWSSPHHLRSFIGSATQMSGDSEIQCLGDLAIRRFGDSAVRRFAATTEQPPKEPWKLRPRPALSHPRPRLRLAMVLMDQTLSREFTTLCPSRTTPVAIQASPRAGSGLLPPAPGASSWSPGPSTSTPKPGHTTPKAPRGFSVFLASFGVSEPLRSELRRSRRSAIPLGDFGDLEVHSHSRTTSEALSASAFRGFLAFLRFDAAVLRSLGDFGGSQPLMNLRGPCVSRVVGLHPDPPELWPAFRPLRLELRISNPLSLGLTCVVPPDRFPRVDAPWVFDLAELAPAVLLWGHLGPLIVGRTKWAELYATEAEGATTAVMRERFNKISKRNELSAAQKLTFKPSKDLTPEERSELEAAYGCEELNPVAKYFYKKAGRRSTLASQIQIAPLPLVILTLLWSVASTSAHRPVGSSVASGLSSEFDEDEDVMLVDDDEDEPFTGELPLLTDSEDESGDEAEAMDVDEESANMNKVDKFVDPRAEIEEGDDTEYAEPVLSLIQDPVRRKINTRVVKMTEGSGWTILKPPKSSTTTRRLGPRTDALVAGQLNEGLRKKMTLLQMKASLRLYTVGPMDFCGHAKSIEQGAQGRNLVVVCPWHPMVSAEQLLANKAWQTIGTWPKGMQKLSVKGMRTEKTLRLKVRKELQTIWTHTRPMNENDVATEVQRQKKMRRQKREEKARDAAKKAKHKGKGKQRMATPPELQAVTLTPKDDEAEFHSTRLNELAGDGEGRRVMRSLASRLLGVRVYSKRN